jgi:DNA replication protein DnaC
MREQILNEAMSIINNRGNQAEIKALENKKKALEDEGFKNLFQDYTSSMIENAKQGKKSDLSAKKSAYEKRLKELSIASVEPDYFCKKCNDSGYIEGQKCQCLKDELNKIILRESGFVSLEEFENAKFDIFENGEYMKKVYSKMKEWCHSNFDKTVILLSGGTGVGKTHLSKCMANELIKKGHLVTLTTAFKMNQDFLKSYSSRDLEEKQALLEKYLSAEILFIDDLGTELVQKGITVNFLYQVLNERKSNKMPTVITTNLDLKDIRDTYDERISSRIIDKQTSICLQIDGKDLRLNKK